MFRFPSLFFPMFVPGLAPTSTVLPASGVFPGEGVRGAPLKTEEFNRVELVRESLRPLERLLSVVEDGAGGRSVVAACAAGTGVVSNTCVALGKGGKSPSDKPLNSRVSRSCG